MGNVISNIFIVDKEKELIQYIQDDYEKIRYLTVSSDKYVTVKCPYCGTARNIQVKQLFRYKTISCKKCSDGRSYPEKFIYSLLEQLTLDFQCEMSIKHKEKLVKYDFYLSQYNMVLEVDGMQHFDKNNKWYLGNDEYKENLLDKNDINIIRIDCRYSDREYIKNSVLSSDLQLYFDLSNIDWNLCHKDACKSVIFDVANKYNSGITDLGELSEIFKIHRKTLRDYLKKANELKLCEFNIEKLKENQHKKVGLSAKARCSKKVSVFKDGVFLGTFNSVTDLCNKSRLLFGVQFNSKHIGGVANQLYGRKTHVGFTFEWT